MNHAPEKEYAATALPIIYKADNCRPAVFRKMRKALLTGLLSILPAWLGRERYNLRDVLPSGSIFLYKGMYFAICFYRQESTVFQSPPNNFLGGIDYEDQKFRKSRAPELKKTSSIKKGS
jgi:hypothetical protein